MAYQEYIVRAKSRVAHQEYILRVKSRVAHQVYILRAKSRVAYQEYIVRAKSRVMPRAKPPQFPAKKRVVLQAQKCRVLPQQGAQKYQQGISPNQRLKVISLGH